MIGPHQDLVEAACSFYKQRLCNNINEMIVFAVLLANTIEDRLPLWARDLRVPAKLGFVNEQAMLVET